ncbi:hypothetical protein [Nocardioides daphniae]|uniref:Uncharacterized protein n=1 Tax=Nocardioides daphniae TaxID=402297 RepID=A0A4P7UEG6_9ACTN|nr:hypothetical protein [Nocardioides daphniae]QCC77805.1 hypothetical protein E2C04_12550 [Nocardioides daphniae]GGD28172.1 hypothetical protein GCM10007231_29620 [Nocardioides daphniae]
MENINVTYTAQQSCQRALVPGAAIAQAWRATNGFGGGVRLRAERAARAAGFVAVDALAGAHAVVVTTAAAKHAEHVAKPAAIAAIQGPVVWSPPPC